ncbi:hypothetical protein JTB14_027586 [Gonioctena quinquepunctata]|nr:hypothetical protein JTB14_027586 [Gonioctena quinquepunctata]
MMNLSQEQSKRSGRPNQSFSGISERAKRKRTASLTDICDSEVLTFAVKKCLRREGHGAASKLISEAVFTTPTRADRIRTPWIKSHQQKNIVPFTEDGAVSLVIVANMSKHQYLFIRQET